VCGHNFLWASLGAFDLTGAHERPVSQPTTVPPACPSCMHEHRDTVCSTQAAYGRKHAALLRSRPVRPLRGRSPTLLTSHTHPSLPTSLPSPPPSQACTPGLALTISTFGPSLHLLPLHPFPPLNHRTSLSALADSRTHFIPLPHCPPSLPPALPPFLPPGYLAKFVI